MPRYAQPFVTAPQEAEAQCATLESLGLVDGVITDDSDVFLFGAERVFKNIFGEGYKDVESYRASDIEQELGCDREVCCHVLVYALLGFE